MNRRSFFAALAAVLAAPKLLAERFAPRTPWTIPPGWITKNVHDYRLKPGPYTLPTGIEWKPGENEAIYEVRTQDQFEAALSSAHRVSGPSRIVARRDINFVSPLSQLPARPQHLGRITIDATQMGA